MRSRRLAALVFTLTAEEPLSIADPMRISIAQKVPASGSTDNTGQLSVPVASGPDGAPIVRGTSVVGPMRAHLARYRVSPPADLRCQSVVSAGAPARVWTRPATLADVFCGSDPEELAPAGPAPESPGGSARTRALRPSALRLISADLDREEGAVRTASRTAINRHRGAAETHKLFTRDELTRATVAVRATVDLDLLEMTLAGLGIALTDPNDALVDLVSSLLDWTPRLGGGGAVGSGTCTLSGLRWGTVDPLPVERLLTAGSTVELIDDIASTTAQEPSALLTASPPKSATPWTWQLPLHAADPLLVSPVDEADDDHQNRSRGADRIRGSSWRGVIRSRCEFILRSCDIDACCSSSATCGACPTCALFGWTPSTGHPDPWASGATGLVRFRTTQIHGESLPLSHVAIDRFTGGSANSKLYTHVAKAPGSTTRVVIEQMDLDRVVPSWARHLLVLAVRDIVDGYVGVGSATTRGYGTVRADDHLPHVPSTWVDELRGPTTHARREDAPE